MRTRSAAMVAATLALAVPMANQALADTQSTDSTVTVAVVSGTRQLAVTGVDGGNIPLSSTAASLAFNNTTTASRFGIITTDLAHSRAGYSVSATLSNLHRLAADGSCTTDTITSNGFSASFPDAVRPTAAIKALVDPRLTFTDDIADDLTTLLGAIDLTGLNTNLTVSSVQGRVDSWTTALALMNSANGAGGTFTNPGAHTACGTGDANTATPVVLQSGGVNDPGTALRDAIFSAVAGDTTLTSTEAITQNSDGVSLLPTNANTAGGVLYEATKSALSSWLATNLPLVSLTDAELASLTADVVADLTGSVTGLVLNLIGQSGIYANAPQMNLAPSAVEGKPTGLYSGRMTVTLVDVS